MDHEIKKKKRAYEKESDAHQLLGSIFTPNE